MKSFIKEKIQILIKSELIRYAIIGVLSTAINIVVFWIGRKFGLDYLLANTIAFIIAVLFSFMANDRIVFKIEEKDSNSLLKRIFKFFTMRAASYFMDMLLLIILVDKFEKNEIISKGFINILVIILNYIVSKYYIFKRG